MIKTKYWDAFSRYFALATEQQERCNLGSERHEDVTEDGLMNHVTLYDVVERKYAGFTQILHDCLYGKYEDHPYYAKRDEWFDERQTTTSLWHANGIDKMSLEAVLALFLIHRLSGSGINYARQPSGYHNTVLPYLAGLDHLQMCHYFENTGLPKFTSGGYQFPRFPKNPNGGLGGEYFIGRCVPTLSEDLADFLVRRPEGGWSLRQVGDFMFEWNRERGLSAYKFQYAAVIADIADFLPEFVDRTSLFYYGSNARECMQWLALREGKNMDDHLDEIALTILDEFGCLPYNSEDVCCDFIRWQENFIRKGGAYDHLDLNKVWNSSPITDHPYGRQPWMLASGLVRDFNELDYVATHAQVINHNGLTPEEAINIAKNFTP